MNYLPLTQKEFKRVEARTKKFWYTHFLGQKPRRSSIKLENAYVLDPLKLSAFVLLILIIFFTGFKAMLGAIPVAESMYIHLTHSVDLSRYPLTPSQGVFTTIMQLMFFVMTELGLIYFLLISKRIVRPEVNKWTDFFSVQWVLSVLPILASVGIVLFVVQISSGVNGTVLDMYLPIAVGMALAFFVEQELEVLEKRNHEIDKRYAEVTKQYNLKQDNMINDSQYMSVLFDYIKEALINKRKGWFTYPNKRLELEDAKIIQDAVYEQWKNHTVNLDFVKKVLQATQNTLESERKLHIDIEGKAVPPNGAKDWTPETLFLDLTARDLVGITRNELGRYYQSGHNVRKAFSALKK
jgi:hypothetical protein